jgi:hypothetical protein
METVYSNVSVKADTVGVMRTMGLLDDEQDADRLVGLEPRSFAGFVCSSYTPDDINAGVVRLLCDGVVIRRRTSETLSKCIDVYDSVEGSRQRTEVNSILFILSDRTKYISAASVESIVAQSHSRTVAQSHRCRGRGWVRQARPCMSNGM